MRIYRYALDGHSLGIPVANDFFSIYGRDGTSFGPVPDGLELITTQVYSSVWQPLKGVRVVLVAPSINPALVGRE